MSEWPTIADTAVDPALKEKWDAFLSECTQLGSEARNIEYHLFSQPERVFVQAEVKRLGDDYGDVYWHGNLDDKDSWGNKFSSDEEEEEEKEIVCGGWGTGTCKKTIPKARPDSPYSDRGLDKVDWFRVIASSGNGDPMEPSILISQGMRHEEEELFFQEKAAYYWHPTKQCTPLDAILRLPGPGCLAYEWIGTDNPMWH